jgi:hypothetical protein
MRMTRKLQKSLQISQDESVNALKGVGGAIIAAGHGNKVTFIDLQAPESKSTS